ncbi:MAG: endonuclease/exonuclease/phosphatase family protein [Marinomonas sp.]
MIKSRYSKVESLTVMGHSSKKVLGPNIQILLWNVFKCKKKGWQKDFVTLIQEKDLILLQEAVINSPFDDIFTHSSSCQWMMASSFKNLKTNIETGVKTGSTVAAKQHYFSASAYGEPLTNTKKMLLAAEYPLTEETESTSQQCLLVINTHIINFVSMTKFNAHLEQVADVIKGHEGPILLAGDFNTWNKKRLTGFNQLAASFSLDKVDMIRQPRLNHFFRHLDHVYCRGLDVIDVQVHTEIHSSDHYPISLSLHITNTTSCQQRRQ